MFKGKFAVVTGGARGLGLTIAGGLVESFVPPPIPFSPAVSRDGVFPRFTDVQSAGPTCRGAHVALVDILDGVDDKEFAPVKRLADAKKLSLTYRPSLSPLPFETPGERPSRAPRNPDPSFPPHTDRSNIADQDVIAQTFADIKQVAQGVGATIGIAVNCAGIQHKESAYEYKAVRPAVLFLALCARPGAGGGSRRRCADFVTLAILP